MGEEVARAEHGDGEVIFDFNVYLTILRQTNDFKDTQEFCALARESEVCDDPCNAVVADPVFQAYLPVSFGDGCAGKTRLSELCPIACNREEQLCFHEMGLKHSSCGHAFDFEFVFASRLCAFVL